MIAAATLHPRRRRRGFQLGVALGAMVPALLFGVATLWPDGSPSSAPASSAPDLSGERAALETYEEQLQPLFERGASIVTYGMRPGLTDISTGHFPDETLVAMARDWLGSMQGLEQDFAALEAPEFLEEVEALFEQSLTAYVATAEALVAAAEATGEERARLLEGVGEPGNRADTLLDQARAVLDEHRVRLGLAASSTSVEDAP